MDKTFKTRLTAIALACMVLFVFSAAPCFAQKLSPVQAPQVQAPPVKFSDPPPQPQTYSLPLPQLVPAPQVARVAVPQTTYETVNVPQTQYVPVTTSVPVTVPRTTFAEVDVPVNALPVNLVAKNRCHPVLHKITHPFEGHRNSIRSTTIQKTVIRG